MTPADRVEAIDIGRGLFGPRNNVQADAANDRPGRRKAVLERIFTRQLPGARIEGRTPQVGRELGVLLTVQFTLIPGQAMKRCVLIRQRGAHPARYFREGRLVLRQIALVHEGELHQGTRRIYQQIRARMNLVDGNPPILIGGHSIDS